MLEMNDRTSAPTTKTTMTVPQPIGLEAIRAPHFGHVSALELTSLSHSLHLMSAIFYDSLRSQPWLIEKVGFRG